MTPLDQSELFTPAPTRKLSVPGGATAFWGVDPSTQRVAVATIASTGFRGVTTQSFPRAEGGERLALIYDVCRGLARELAQMPHLFPAVIVVEQPSGKQPNPALSYAVGAIMGGLFAGLVLSGAGGAKMPMVSSASWKKVACGAGNAYKPKNGKIEDYAVWRWARSAGYTGRSFDECDAWGIVEYARRTYALEQR